MVEGVTEVFTALVAADLEEGDHERMAHIVYLKDKLTEAMVTGTPGGGAVRKVWTPYRDRNGSRCVERLQRLLSGERR